MLIKMTFQSRLNEGGIFLCKARGFEHLKGGQTSANVKVVARP